jgi:hypothetical protein
LAQISLNDDIVNPGDFSMLRDRFSSSVTKLEGQLQAEESRRKHAENELVTIRMKMQDEISSLHDRLEKEIESRVNESNTAQSRIAELEDDNLRLHCLVELREKEVRTQEREHILEDELKTCKNELKSVATERNVLAQDCATLRRRVGELVATATKIEQKQKSEAANATNSEKEFEISQLRGKLEQKQGIIRSLQESLRRKEERWKRSLEEVTAIQTLDISTIAKWTTSPDMHK